MRVWSMGLAALAGLYGAAGVVLAAAGAHLAAGPTVTTAAYFLLFHAVALVAACALVHPLLGFRRRAAAALLSAASLWAAGAFLFSGDLALRALAGETPVRLAAPTGGILMIGGWLVAAVALPMTFGVRIDRSRPTLDADSREP